ncbi:MAG: biopolymer transporter ExbD, partial [Actinomycetia bacterium]|nr:biopolymer transporter ExbD [Actinomycetes bacterium]
MKIKRKSYSSFEVPSSSMSDISFILIVFFMVASIFNIKEGIDVNIPDRYAVPKNVRTDQLFKVEIYSNTDIRVNGRRTDIEKIIGLAAVSKEKNPRIIALIKVFGETEYGIVARVFSDIQRSGI